MLVQVRHDFDLYRGPQHNALCRTLSADLQRRGFLAIKVPDTLGPGRISRDPARRPGVTLRDYPSAGKRTSVPLSFRDEFLPAINFLFPIAPGELAHWEVLGLTQVYTVECTIEFIQGVLTYTLEVPTTATHLELDLAGCVDGNIRGAPFYWPGSTHCFGRFRAILDLSAQTRDILALAQATGEYVNPGDIAGFCHTLWNRDAARAYTVDLTYYSALRVPMQFYPSWESATPITSVQVSALGNKFLCLKGTIPTTITSGVGTVVITGTARSNPVIRAVAIDTLGVPGEWIRPYSTTLRYIPLVKRQ